MRLRLVHWSRLIHIAEDLLEDEIFGRPRMLPAWNYLDDMDKVIGACAEAFWINSDRGMQLDLDKDMLLDDKDAETLTDEVDEFVHGFRRFVRTQGITMKQLGTTIAEPTGSFRAIMALIAGTTGIPQRVLLGAEAGQMASMQDAANWNELVAERQKVYGEPVMLRALIDRLVNYKMLPAPEGNYSVRWPDLLALSEADRSLVAMRYGAANLNLSQALAMGNSPITGGEARVRLFGLPAEQPLDPDASNDEQPDPGGNQVPGDTDDDADSNSDKKSKPGNDQHAPNQSTGESVLDGPDQGTPENSSPGSGPKSNPQNKTGGEGPRTVGGIF